MKQFEDVCANLRDGITIEDVVIEGGKLGVVANVDGKTERVGVREYTDEAEAINYLIGVLNTPK